jgi:hypothetical protein
MIRVRRVMVTVVIQFARVVMMRVRFLAAQVVRLRVAQALMVTVVISVVRVVMILGQLVMAIAVHVEMMSAMIGQRVHVVRNQMRRQSQITSRVKNFTVPFVTNFAVCQMV